MPLPLPLCPCRGAQRRTAIRRDRGWRCAACSPSPRRPVRRDCIFRSKSVALIGASRQKHAISWDILDNLLRQEFQGQIFPVNPKADVVHSLKCYPSVEAIPDHLDLAIIAVPKQHVAAQAEACGRKGVKGLVVITAGFKEVGEGGGARERDVLQIVQRCGMRMVGPSCMGVVNTDPEVRLQGTFSVTAEPISGGPESHRGGPEPTAGTPPAVSRPAGRCRAPSGTTPAPRPPGR